MVDLGACIAQEVKQIKLTEKHIQSFMAAYDDIAKLYYGANQDKPDPKVEAQAGALRPISDFVVFARADAAPLLRPFLLGIVAHLLPR